MSCTCYGAYNPGCEEHGKTVQQIADEAIARIRAAVPQWAKQWLSPPCECVCRNPECVIGDRWFSFLLREDQAGQVGFQVIPVDRGTGEPYRGQVQVYGFDGKVYPYRYGFDRAKQEIEDCMKEGTTFTGFPHWHLELTGGVLPIKRVEAWKQ